MQALKAFARLNRQLSHFIAPRHLGQNSAYTRYSYEFFRALSQQPVGTVLDVGAGQHWFFDAQLKEKFKFKLIGSDISLDELNANKDLDQKIVSDACVDLGVPKNSVDVITARAGFEHFNDNRAFLRNCARVLTNDGVVILSFAGRYAPFAVANRMLPEPVAKWLLSHLIPDSKEKLGFKAYYDQCTNSGVRNAAREAGLTVETAFYDFYSSDYFGFFFPAFVLSLIYDHVRHILGIKDIASYYTFVLRKKANVERSVLKIAAE